MDKLLILFVKYPEPGRVKTRLGKDIGFERASDIYETLVRKQIRDLTSPDYDLVVCADPCQDIPAYQRKFGSGQPYWFQDGSDLGVRMANAFSLGFEHGYSQVLLMGSDIPMVDIAGINVFFELLGPKQMVIGPALDGGYYLIGFNAGVDFKPVFQQIPWSTTQVFEKTMETASGLDIAIGKQWFDVDTVSDLNRYETLKATGKSFLKTELF